MVPRREISWSDVGHSVVAQLSCAVAVLQLRREIDVLRARLVELGNDLEITARPPAIDAVPFDVERPIVLIVQLPLRGVRGHRIIGVRDVLRRALTPDDCDLVVTGTRKKSGDSGGKGSRNLLSNTAWATRPLPRSERSTVVTSV